MRLGCLISLGRHWPTPFFLNAVLLTRVARRLLGSFKDHITKKVCAALPVLAPSLPWKKGAKVCITPSKDIYWIAKRSALSQINWDRLNAFQKHTGSDRHVFGASKTAWHVLGSGTRTMDWSHHFMGQLQTIENGSKRLASPDQGAIWQLNKEKGTWSNLSDNAY